MSLLHDNDPFISDFADTDPESKIRRPVLFRVIMHNDDYTAMDFVVDILVSVFHQNIQQAEQLMHSIHKTGSAVCGVYPRDIALTKIQQVHQSARKMGYPLRCTCEEV